MYRKFDPHRPYQFSPSLYRTCEFREAAKAAMRARSGGRGQMKLAARMASRRIVLALPLHITEKALSLREVRIKRPLSLPLWQSAPSIAATSQYTLDRSHGIRQQMNDFLVAL